MRMAWRMTRGLRGLCPNYGLTAWERLSWLRRCYSTVFVSRLSSYITEDGLRKLFLPFGSIKEVSLIRDKNTGRPKGFGFVKYQHADDAQKALKSMNYRMVDGRLIFVEMAKPTEEKGEIH